MDSRAERGLSIIQDAGMVHTFDRQVKGCWNPDGKTVPLVAFTVVTGYKKENGKNKEVYNKKILTKISTIFIKGAEKRIARRQDTAKNAILNHM